MNTCRHRRTLVRDNLTSWLEPNSLSGSIPTYRGQDAGERRRDLDDDKADKDREFVGEREGTHQQNDNFSTAQRMP